MKKENEKKILLFRVLRQIKIISFYSEIKIIQYLMIQRSLITGSKIEYYYIFYQTSFFFQ